MNNQIHIEDFEAINKIVAQAASKLWKKSYRMCWHVFSSFEDTTQVGWTALCAKKSSQAAIALPIDGNEGLINTIAYRGMVDYMRSVIGRKDNPNSDRSLQLYCTTRYMDYYKNNKNGDEYSSDDLLDLIMPQVELKTPESLLIASTMQKDIDDFLISKLNRREKMIMDHIFKDDYTQKEVSKKFAVTESRISQIRTKAIEKARERFPGVLLPSLHSTHLVSTHARSPGSDFVPQPRANMPANVQNDWENREFIQNVQFCNA